MKDENRKTARLIKQIQRGKQSAFEEFYRLTSPRAYFLALKITQNEHDAEDILQESYIKALEKINEIDTSQNVTSWFLKIVSNKSKDLLKSRNRLAFEDDEDTFFEEIPEEKTEFCPEESLNQEELRLEVMAAIDELTAEKRACIMMMYFGDMSVKEIAQSIAVPESTVKNRLYTARKDLKTRFEKNGNILYGAALGGLLIWALNKTSVTASAAFLAGTSAETAAASASTAASAGTGMAAKAAAATVAQKIAVGVAAAAVIGGSTAGVVSVVKNTAPEETTTQITEAVTTAPVFTTEYVFNETVLTETSAESVSSSLKTTSRTSTGTTAAPSTTAEPECTTAPVTETSSAEPTEEEKTTTSASRRTTTRRYTDIFTTTVTETETTQVSETETTTRRRRTTTTEAETTSVTETEEEETTRTTTRTTTEAATESTTETTAESTTQAPATLIIDIIDMNGDVADTLNLTVDAGTEMTWEYLISLIKQNGYEAKAGVYGDGVGAVAESGTTYTFEAEL